MLKCLYYPQTIYRLNTIPIKKIAMTFSRKLDQIILK